MNQHRYCIMLEGGNLYLHEDSTLNEKSIENEIQGSTLRLMGFFTTRCVKSDNEGHAIQKAINLATKEIAQNKLSRNTLDNPPYIFVYKISRISYWRSLFIPSKGFTFFSHEHDIEKPENAVTISAINKSMGSDSIDS